MRVSYLDTVNAKKSKDSIKHNVVLVEGDGSLKLKKVLDVEDLDVLNNELSNFDKEEEYRIFFDQSTNTGYSIFQGTQLKIMGKISMGAKGGLERYKFRLKDIVNNYMSKLNVKEVWYEEVYDEKNMRTTEVLMYIKHLFKDIGYTNRKEESGVGVYGVDHTKWKSILSDKGIKKNQDDKEQVRKYVFDILNIEDELDGYIDEDMSDAVGMGVARCIKSNDKSFYMMARYETKLPIHESVIINDEVDFKTVKMRKPFREAREYGVIVYESDDGKLGIKPHELARRVLTHTDKLVAVEIPKKYREYGVLLLLNNIKYEDFKDEKDKMYMLFARKRRL